METLEQKFERIQKKSRRLKAFNRILLDLQIEAIVAILSIYKRDFK